MLTGDLIRVRSNGTALKVQFVDSADPALLRLARDLIGVYANGVGKNREALDLQTQTQTMQVRDRKLAGGLVKILEDRTVFSASEDADFPALRRRLFEHSASLLKTPGALPPDPESVRTAVFSGAPEDCSFLKENGIYTDLPENETLVSFPKMFPKELLERYNMGLVQALILRAARLELLISASEDPANLRRLFKYLRFFRLLVSASLRNGKITLSVDGPASIFENSAKYGLQLASFFPAVCQLKEWSFSCTLKLHGKEKKLSLNQSSGLVSHYSNFSAYRPEEIQLFANLFQEQSEEWKMDESPGYVQPDGGQTLIFPDFYFSCVKPKKKFMLELFHRWHASQFGERLDYCEAHPEFGLLLGVDRSLLKKDGILADRLAQSTYFQTHGFLFRDFPGVSNLKKLLRNL